MPQPSSDTTAQAIRAAMTSIRDQVEGSRDPVTGLHRYHGPTRGVTTAEVLRRAGIKSRTTLGQAWHADLRREVDTFVQAMRRLTGKDVVGGEDISAREAHSLPRNRVAEMAQKLVAKDFEIARLRLELEDLKKGTPPRVVNLRN